MNTARPVSDYVGLARQGPVPSAATGPDRGLALPDQAVDVVISNCVITTSTDKPAVLAEMFRVLVPCGLAEDAQVLRLHQHQHRTGVDSFGGTPGGEQAPAFDMYGYTFLAFKKG